MSRRPRESAEDEDEATFRLPSLSLLLFELGLQVLLRPEEAGLLGRSLRQPDPLLLQLFQL